MNTKERLKNKIEIELENKEERRNFISIYSIMEDYYNIILLEDYSAEDLEIMFKADNLLEELAILWLDDERVIELQEKILAEYLAKVKGILLGERK